VCVYVRVCICACMCVFACLCVCVCVCFASSVVRCVSNLLQLQSLGRRGQTKMEKSKIGVEIRRGKRSGMMVEN
jgi:hypothetical protein